MEFNIFMESKCLYFTYSKYCWELRSNRQTEQSKHISLKYIKSHQNVSRKL